VIRAGKHAEACLVHIYPSGPDMGRRYPLHFGKVYLGRGESLDIRVRDNAASRTHAVIETDEEGSFLQDQQSLNGTHVNDLAIKGTYPLADGDYIRIGNAIFRYLTGGNIEVDYHEEIYRLTIMDGLTQTFNHRYLSEFLERELARAQRHQRPLSVLMFDLDRFKAVNDNYGHLGGDHVLREMSARIRPTVRREDLFARYGGEEFCIVLVETTLAQAIAAGERIRNLVEQAPFTFDGESIPVTLSVGVSTATKELGTAQDLLKAADGKLYQAKRAGRNCVVC